MMQMLSYLSASGLFVEELLPPTSTQIESSTFTKGLRKVPLIMASCIVAPFIVSTPAAVHEMLFLARYPEPLADRRQ